MAYIRHGRAMTHVNFLDLRAESPNGRFVVEAFSVENGRVSLPEGRVVARPSFFGFQHSFRFRCIDTRSNLVLWERWQTEAEESPVCLYVSDLGECAIRCQGSVYVLDARGDARVRVDVRPPEFVFASPPREPVFVDDHVADTSGGLRWGDCAIAFFLSADDARFFVLTPWWGRRIILDLTNQRWCGSSNDQGATGRCAAQILETERTIARQVVNAALSTIALPDPPGGLGHGTDIVTCGQAPQDQLWLLFAALATVHEQRLVDLADTLDRLQRHGQLGGVEVPPRAGHFVSPVHIRTVADLRCGIARLLRLFGHTPAPIPGYLTRAELQRGDHAEVGDLQPGMSPEEVLKRAGAPSYVREHPHYLEGEFRRDEYWEYDFGVSETGRTIHLYWSDQTPGILTRLDDPGVPIWLDPRFRRRLVDL